MNSNGPALQTENRYDRAVRIARQMRADGIGARTAKGNIVGKYVALYNNVGAVLKNAVNPMTQQEVYRHNAVITIAPTKQKIQDVLIWYVKRGLIKRIRREPTDDDRSLFNYRWVSDSRPVPDHAIYKVRRKRKSLEQKVKEHKQAKEVRVKRPYVRRKAFASNLGTQPVQQPTVAVKSNGMLSPAEYIYQHDIGFLEGNIISCLTVWKDKGVNWLLDAQQYMNKLIELESNKTK